MAKGTLSSDIYKGSGSRDFMVKYRSIFLGSTKPKLHHKFMRDKLTVLACILLKDSQYGGRKGGSCELPMLLVRSFGIVLNRLKLSSSPFFYDITNAYYSVVRSLLSSTFTMPEDVQTITLSLDGAHALIEATQTMLGQPGALDQWATYDERRQLLQMLGAQW